MGANDRQPGGNHYGGKKFQHWDLMAHNNIGYLEGCASKYASRWDRKGAPIVDLEKGIHYCDKIIEMIENIGYKASHLTFNSHASSWRTRLTTTLLAWR
jgi:hypothetical protein